MPSDDTMSIDQGNVKADPTIWSKPDNAHK